MNIFRGLEERISFEVDLGGSIEESGEGVRIEGDWNL